ncbi:MAG: DUF692 domain-containing protein [Burkholderiaceae bacterium]|nr:DUF692 domain-containing protein [Burkholderiaceae bacterium]
MNSIQGFGLGLRTEHYAAFESEPHTRVDWLEILSENYMVPGGAPLWHLDRIRRDFPMVMHGVSLNIGGSDPLNLDYLRDLKALVQRVQPGWVSDHLCWTGTQGLNMHDLLPVPYTEETLCHITERILRVQDFLGRRLVIENPSTYVAFAANQMPEWEFVAAMLRLADCELLLDVNNVFVSSVNHGFDPQHYIDAIPAARVRQIHLAGHTTHDDGYLIDTHDHPVCAAVWQLYGYTLQHCGSVPTMIERDDNIPALHALLDELDQARQVHAQALAPDPEPVAQECLA